MKNSYKKRKKTEIFYYSMLAIVALVIVALVLSFMNPKERSIEIPELITIPELSVSGYLSVEVDASVSDNVGRVVLTGGCYQLEAMTESVQAESIINGIERRIGLRPNTHDLMKDTFDNFGIDVLMVRITELRNSTFIGKLVLKQGSKILSLDSRPSDGIALALRYNAPIYIKEDLMESQGEYIC